MFASIKEIQRVFAAFALATGIGAASPAPAQATLISWNVDTSCPGPTPAFIAAGPQQATGFILPAPIAGCVSPGDVSPVAGTNGPKYILSSTLFEIYFPLSTGLSFNFGASQGDLVTATAYRGNTVVGIGATLSNGLSQTAFFDANGMDRIIFKVQETGGDRGVSYILADDFSAETKLPFVPAVATTPEPASLAILLTGMACMSAVFRRRRDDTAVQTASVGARAPAMHA